MLPADSVAITKRLEDILKGLPHIELESDEEPRIEAITSNFKLILPGVNRLYSILSDMRCNSLLAKDRIKELYPIAMSEVASLSDTIQDTISKVDKQGKSMETLRRYERATRQQLRAVKESLEELLKELKKEEEGYSIVGSFLWNLKKEDVWVLGPESAFTFKDIWRRAIVREAYMLDEDKGFFQKWKNRLATAFRRCITGESVLFDLYISESDNAQLGISSDEIGGNLYFINVDRNIIGRRAVYFGNQRGIMMRAKCPLGDAVSSFMQIGRYALKGEKLKPKLKGIVSNLKKTVYGPGWIFQRFIPIKDEKQYGLLMQMDGDMYCRNLAEGETLRLDPRFIYAWDESVDYDLVKFGNVGERLLRGTIPFHTEFKGPGRIWFSNKSFEEGYLGSLFTPSHWLYKTKEFISSLLDKINPF
jgi:hypothetical protein